MRAMIFEKPGNGLSLTQMDPPEPRAKQVLLRVLACAVCRTDLHVIDGELINLVVAPEVSQLDKTNAVSFNGFVIPGISTRRAKTTVELRDGQSFAIAGLLASDFTDDMRGLPGVMDVPVLGALFRSSQYQRNETELVVIVTPKLVQPVAAGTLAAPTDTFVPPSDTQFFLNGKTENPDSGLTARMNGGGLTGQYGYILR